MSNTTSDTAATGGGIDLSQFHQIFFEEAAENLESLEQQLLVIDIESADDEVLNAIFRCAHSVKGGAATFGFSDIAELTHQMESLLDKLRRHDLKPTAAMVDVLLQSGDALKAQLARHQNLGADAPIDTSDLLDKLRSLLAGESVMPAAGLAQAVTQVSAPAPVQAPASTPATAPSLGDHPTPARPDKPRELELILGPLDKPEVAEVLHGQFKNIADLGSIEALADEGSGKNIRRFKIVTSSSDADLFDLFTLHVAREQVRLMPFTAAPQVKAVVAVAPLQVDANAGYGFFDDMPEPPSPSEVSPAQPIAAPSPSGAVRPPGTLPAAPPDVASATAAPPAKAQAKAATAPPAAEAATLRVSVEKVDQLINLVGELVITQAMLAQNSAEVDPALYQQMAIGLADLQRNTRDLQESVMSIRMIPMSAVFNRFPRMLRDLAAKLGKKVDFVTRGEATELDKGMVEKITDPLTHLVRNSCDHGIEMPADRIAKGKPELGTITLSASHQGGSIVIEVRDDGAGLNRSRLLQKAREKGIHAPDSISDTEVWDLIFAPGFSTAEVVSDVSGRGVGMDVVKRNIASLGGSVEIESIEGIGMSVKVRLPLTLAIMDSMSVAVASECYILPLSSVVESFQFSPDKVKTIGGNSQVVQVRDEFLPVLKLETVFDVVRKGEGPEKPILVVVEADGRRLALLVDELLGQQQVVVKNLESNYGKVDNISGATIIGDGRVALILDVNALVRRSRH